MLARCWLRTPEAEAVLDVDEASASAAEVVRELADAAVLLETKFVPLQRLPASRAVEDVEENESDFVFEFDAASAGCGCGCCPCSTPPRLTAASSAGQVILLLAPRPLAPSSTAPAGGPAGAGKTFEFRFFFLLCR